MEQTADHREQASDGLVKVFGPNGTVSEDQAVAKDHLGFERRQCPGDRPVWRFIAVDMWL